MGEKLAHIQEIDNYFNIWWPFIKYSEKYKLHGCQILQHDLLQSVAVKKQLSGKKEKSLCGGERWLVFWPPVLFSLPFKKQYTCQRFTWGCNPRPGLLIGGLLKGIQMDR